MPSESFSKPCHPSWDEAVSPEDELLYPSSSLARSGEDGESLEYSSDENSSDILL